MVWGFQGHGLTLRQQQYNVGVNSFSALRNDVINFGGRTCLIVVVPVGLLALSHYTCTE